MSRQSSKVREEVIVSLSRLGVPLDAARRFLRLGATLHRLAEAQCNGDWPAEGPWVEKRTAIAFGTRHAVRQCTYGPNNLPGVGFSAPRSCGTSWAISSLRKTRGYLCPDCCAAQDAEALAKQFGLRAVTQGDPRGAVLLLVPGETSREDVDSGRVRGIFVY